MEKKDKNTKNTKLNHDPYDMSYVSDEFRWIGPTFKDVEVNEDKRNNGNYHKKNYYNNRDNYNEKPTYSNEYYSYIENDNDWSQNNGFLNENKNYYKKYNYNSKNDYSYKEGGYHNYKNSNYHNHGQKSKYQNNYNNYKQNDEKLTHFINIPIKDEEFCKKYQEFKEDLSKIVTDTKLIQPIIKLHFTVCVLSLKPNQVEKVKSIMDNLLKSNYLEFKKFSLKLDSFTPMKENPNENRVIFGDVGKHEKYDNIKEIFHLIIEALVNNGIMNEESLKVSHIEKKDGKYQNIVHLTILNTKFLKKNYIRCIENGSNILNCLNNGKFISQLPEFPLDRIDFCQFKIDYNTGTYPVESSHYLL